MKSSILTGLCLVVLTSGLVSGLECEDFAFQLNDWNTYTYKAKLLAKAKIDECFFGVSDSGDSNNVYPFGGSCDDCYSLGGQPKVNQAYVWGLTYPVSTDSYVCEFGNSQFSPPLPDIIGDWRPPDLFVYNTTTETLTNLKPLIYIGGDGGVVETSLGIRSAGSHNNVVFLAGPALEPDNSISMFAFKNDTGDYLGSTILPYDNIRKWIVAADGLYTSASSKVIRWVGDVNDPFQFEEVGNLKGSGAELAYHNGRLFISTWPSSELPGQTANAGLWMSPVVGDGLTAANVNEWVQVWDVNEYEPDPVIAATYGGGAVASYGDYLYWGTMHVPFLSTEAHISVYGDPVCEGEVLTTALRCHRAISIFKGRNLDTTPEVHLLYGESSLPAYHPMTGWQNVPTGYSPWYGSSGFNNFFNNYTWTMAVYDDQLFVGTMDWSYLVFGEINDCAFPGYPAFPPLPVQCKGADLFRFSSPYSSATPVSLAGVGNYSNYGIRTMVSDDVLYMGTANPMNLLTDPIDDKPEGGWELRRLVLCKTRLVGDINRDRIVDFKDYALLANNWLDEVGSCE
ncbi:MAG: hypothetical protein ACYTBP_14550 [Planctomycetota bacterium]|jgi:hypothetical protein